MAGKTVSWSRNGSAAIDSGLTDGGGMYTLSGATMTGGTIVTVYLDGETEDAVTVTLATNAGTTGAHLYQNRLITRSDSGTVALTSANLDIADNSGDSDITAIYHVDSSTEFPGSLY